MSTEPGKLVDFKKELTLPGKLFALPESTMSREHFCAMETAPSGLIYYGTCNTTGGAGSPSEKAIKEGKFSVKSGAHFVSFDPATGKQVDLGNMQVITGEDPKKTFPQSKVHSMIDFDDDGIAYFGSHSAQWYGGIPKQRAYLYPGGHVISYNPKDGAFTDHGILEQYESIIPSAYDKKRRRFFALTHPNCAFVSMDLKTGNTTRYNYEREYGKKVAGPPRGMVIDDFGRVFCFVKDGVVRYDPATDKGEVVQVFPKGLKNGTGIHLAGVALGPVVYKKGCDGPTCKKQHARDGHTHRMIYGAAATDKGPMLVEYDPDDGKDGAFRIITGTPYNFEGQMRTMAINRGPDGNIYYMGCYGNTDKIGGGRLFVYKPKQNLVQYLGQITIGGKSFDVGSTGLAVSNDGKYLMVIGFRPKIFRPKRPDDKPLETDMLAIARVPLPGNK